MDASANDVAATIARHSGGRTTASHFAAPTHGPGDRGRGSAAAINPALWHQSGYSLRSCRGGGGCASLRSQQEGGRIHWPQPERVAERELRRGRSTETTWKGSAACLTHPIRQKTTGSK